MGTPPSGLREWCATTSASIRTRGRRCPRRRAARSPCPSRSPRAEAGAGTDKPTTTVRRRRHCVRNLRRCPHGRCSAGGGRTARRPPRRPAHPRSFCSQTSSSLADLLVTRCCTDATRAHATTEHAKSLRAHRREGATSSVSLDTSAGSPSQPDGIGLAFAALWSAPAGIVNSEEGRTHMLREHRSLIVWPSVIAAGLLAAACTDQPKVSMAPKPSFWVTPGPAQCTGGKWTGGGRIDPTNPPGPNHDAADETSGGQPPAFDPAPFNPEGKFTFGFNVFLAVDLQTGRCFVQKGEIEVNGHPFKVAWHVSIHDGIDTFRGEPVEANVFSNASGGVCLVVGIPDAYMVARVNPGSGREHSQFEVCDNDRGRSQGGRTLTGFHVDAMRCRAAPLRDGETGPIGDTGLTDLTGGNVVAQGSSPPGSFQGH